MMKITVPILTAAFMVTAPSAFSQDRPLHCSSPPHVLPVVPDGTKATTKQIMAARKGILDYSTAVDTYLTCMEQRTRWFAPYMTENQKTRYDEDLTKINDKLRELQLALNKSIRDYRNSRKK